MKSATKLSLYSVNLALIIFSIVLSKEKLCPAAKLFKNDRIAGVRALFQTLRRKGKMFFRKLYFNVIPANAGTQSRKRNIQRLIPVPWVPAFAGMTEFDLSI
jgi:hypothetical protein